MNLYTVYDREAKTHSPPMAQPNDVAASRMFTFEVNRNEPGNMLSYAPEHFVLIKIGSMDDTTGVLTPEYTPLLEAAAARR